MYTTLISAEELKSLMASGQPLMVFDCSFDLMNPAAGEEAYRRAHIPGAVYAHLDTDLSDKGTPDPQGKYHPHPDAASGGRHPLPNREKFAVWLSTVGFANDMQAVVYDRNGANYCGRLWWMLKWAGHEAVAVLDGGLQAWQAAGGEVTDRTSSPTSSWAPSCARWSPPNRCCIAWAARARPSWMHAPRRASKAKWSRWTLWPAISLVPSTARSRRTSAPTASSSRRRSCVPSSNSCSRDAIRPPWCITAAAA
jgi:rhodanese-related sulfurtransferase